MRSAATRVPLIAPTSAPARMVTAMTPVVPHGSGNASSRAPTTLVSATTEPTLRSMPPLTMISVMPSAPMATMTVWVKMILKLPPVRKTSRTSGLMEKMTTTKSRPRKGPKSVRSFLKLVPFMGYRVLSRRPPLR